MTISAREKFQTLLRELFQFDCADLDFGVYRVMNHKRQVIERWIADDLPRAISDELQRGALAEQGQAQEALQAVRQKVLDALGEDALDADGNLAEAYRATKAGRAYLEAQEKARGARSGEALEAAIYNHLYTFFSRYWQEGDFISKRRYSKKERYAIPYNGEEVTLYWANHDQYYIKTGEYFTDYAYKAPNGVTVHFKLRQADVEQNNVKGEKRFFLPVLEGIAWDEARRTLTIPFEFRPLTAQEAIAYGQKNPQEAIIAKAIADIPKRAKEMMNDERGMMNQHSSFIILDSSLLERHLRRYTRRNTGDFFIHKDLRGFLSRELDFYLKNEVLNLEEMEAAGETLAEGWFQLLRLIKRVGLHIIDFLAQIEDFQKMLWEKKKFVAETFYVITVGNIPEAFYPEIAACEAQWEEWERLGMLNAECRKMNMQERSSFLMHHSSLPLDTRHFPQDFTDRLLASFEDLDDMTDGLLVHSENWQALNLLQEKYRERVKCIYIDPPYNTGSDDFLYRDNYQHSSWLAMMENRLSLGRDFLTQSSLAFVNIDEREQARLESLLVQVFGTDNLLGPFVWLARAGKAVTERQLQVAHEYVLCAAKSIADVSLKLVEKKVTNCRYRDERGAYNRELLRQWGGQGDRREDRPTLFFPIPSPFGIDVYPKRPDGSDGRWRASRDDVEKMLRDGDLDFVRDEITGEITVYRKIREGTVTLSAPSNILDNCGTSATATTEIKSLFGDKAFDTAKPVNLAKHCISLADNNATYVLDFFAGSGTTGHAVIALNREDGGRRKFILVEMAHYFDTVLLPRIKKVTFTPEWKDGQPKRMATQEEAERSPRIIKVIRLESYEDALNNLTFDDASGRQALDLFRDDYLLHYMLKWETRHSETLLDVEKLQTPFAYKLRIHRDGETRERLVDLPETFNYLLGLDVQTRKVYRMMNDERGMQNHHSSFLIPPSHLVYRGTLRNGRKVAIIWRDTTGWTKEDYERERDFVAEQKLTAGADEVFVNGDSLIPGARSLDPIFKEKMMNAE